VGTHVSNNEIMDLFRAIGVVRLNSTLSETEAETEVEKIREIIVKKMSFLVYYHTKRYINLPNYEDLVQEGFMGVVKAVNKFKWEMYPNFFAYSDQWIRNGIKKAASRFDVVYNPDRSRVIYAEPDEDEVDAGSTPDEILFEKERSRLISKVLEEYPERERLIVKKIFGLEGHDQETLREIGPQFDMSYEGIRQIKEKVIDKLREDSSLQEIVLNLREETG